MSQQEEEIIKSKLLKRGFPEKHLLNNRGLIGATIEETLSLIAKTPEELDCDHHFISFELTSKSGQTCVKCGIEILDK